jgi:hypothetical protein
MSLPAPFEQGFLDITDYRFMEEIEEDSRSAGYKPLGPECTGIVLHSLFGGVEQVSPQSNRPVVKFIWSFVSNVYKFNSDMTSHTPSI